MAPNDVDRLQRSLKRWAGTIVALTVFGGAITWLAGVTVGPDILAKTERRIAESEARQDKAIERIIEEIRLLRGELRDIVRQR